MGAIKHMLSYRRTLHGSGYDHFIMEAAENVHLHWRDTRINLYPEEIEPFYRSVKAAYERIKELGFPSYNDKNVSLFAPPMKCKEPGIFYNIASIEEQEVGGIHIHWRDTRLHMDKAHFIEFAYMFRDALSEFMRHNKKTIKIDDLEKPEGVSQEYYKMLEDYEAGKYKDKYEAKDCHYFCLKRGRDREKMDHIDPDVDRSLLFTLYESIKKYGYAKGPYINEYATVWKRPDGKLYFSGAHRWAVLKKLGYKEIDVCIIPMPDPKIVKEQ